ncbi:MAG: nicotinate phosphoribosyltransferase [bacterium]|nr:nicotinate phosphoribosyltransferase [bacterium]
MLNEGILFTDHYQLTMAQLYHGYGLADRRAQFDYHFRSYPDYGVHQAGYCISAGLGPLVDWMENTWFDEQDLAALRTIRTSSGERLFKEPFLEWLEGSDGFQSLSMWAIPEGRVVHAQTPVVTVEGPLAVAQLLETALLNRLNYAILIAGKTSRAVEAAGGNGVLEFGMRRAPGAAAHTATRSALIGGATGSSNFAASYELGFLPRGTHAHSLVQVFIAECGSELEAFRAYADLYPDDCLLLVDTINTLESGVPNAITVFEELRKRGHRPVGIRLDSGDLAHLAVRSAALLDRAGFPDVSIVLSSDLDELIIWQVRNQILEEAGRYGVDADHLLNRLVYGVGTRLVTSDGCPSLNGVFKLVAVEGTDGNWAAAIKISEDPTKVLDPGRKRLWRIYDHRGTATVDLITESDYDPAARPIHLVHPGHPDIRRTLGATQISEVEPLRIQVLNNGERVADNLGDIEAARNRRVADLARLDPGVRRLVNPHTYHVSLSLQLSKLKQDLIADFRS